MSTELDALKAKIEAQNTALDSISTNVAGIGEDVTALKAKIEELKNGATAAEIAELSAMLDGVSTKIDAIGKTTADLDASTDPDKV